MSQSKQGTGTNSPGKDSLASILTFNERSDLVNLVESITIKIVDDANAPFEKPVDVKDGESAPNPTLSDMEIETIRKASSRWYSKWKSIVLKRVCEAANTRWEPLAQKGNSTAKSWDELSWDDEPMESKRATATALDANLQNLYPPIPTPLLEQERDKRLLLLHSMMLLLLSLKHYYAPSRLLLLLLASSLNLSMDDVDKDEERTATSLVSGAQEMSAKEEVQKKAQASQTSRNWKVFGASVAGAALIGLTGGLAAPLVAAGIGTVMGGLGLGATAAAGLLGSLAGSSVLVGGLFGAYGARMTGQMMEQYAQEISDFAFIPIRSKKGSAKTRNSWPEQDTQGEDVQTVEAEDRRLRVTIGVSGWLTERSDVVQPWKVLSTGTEVFALRWEVEALSRLGSGMREMITSAAWNYARTEILKLTVFSTLIGAVALPLGLLQLGRLVDNPFHIAKTRADKAGEVLADAIINRAQGERPVALIGYSLGARLIYSCLQNLTKRQAFGLVDSVVLCGAPVPSSDSEWRKIRSVVGGRLVNIYSENDYVLGFLYRATSVQAGIAGLQKVTVPGVEDINLSETVTSHFHYRHLLGQTLRDLGWRDLDEGELRRETEALENLKEQERKITELLESEKTDGQEKQRLKDLMETQAPVQETEDTDIPQTEEKAPKLPPRRPVAEPIDGRQSDPRREARQSEEDSHQIKPMQNLEHPRPENESDEDDELNEGFRGIKMEDND